MELPPAPRGIRPEEVARLVDEMRDIAVGARIGKVYDAGDDAVVLRLLRRDGRYSLLASVAGGFTRFHFLPDDVAPRVVEASRPSERAMQLRELLRGGKVHSIDQPGGDRIVRIAVTVRRGGRRIERALILELFGRSGRVIVCEGEARDVLLVFGRGGIEPGARYWFPPPPDRTDRMLFPFDPMQLIPETERASPLAFHHALARAMARAEATAGFAARRESLRRRIDGEVARHRALLDRLDGDLARAARWQEVEREGELLKAAMGTLRRGQSEALVTDFYDPDLARRPIALDPGKTPAQNVEGYFRRARKLKRGEPVIAMRRRECAEDLEALAPLGARLEAAGDAESLAEVESALAALRIRARPHPRPSPARRAAAALPAAERAPRRFRSRQGFEILAGRSARENDRLTFTLARGNDLFFHVTGRPGPHVILRVPRGKVASPESLDDAAFVAAWLGGWRGPERIAVTWTQVKYVKKPRGAPPGTVHVSQEREFWVTHAPGRLESLGGGGGAEDR